MCIEGYKVFIAEVIKRYSYDKIDYLAWKTFAYDLMLCLVQK